MPDSTHAAMNSMVIREDPAMGDSTRLDELRDQFAASEHLIADLKRELGRATEQEAEAVLQLDIEGTRVGALDQELHQARKEANSLTPHEGSPETVANQRDRHALEVAQLTDALAAKQVLLAELPNVVAGSWGIGGAAPIQVEQTAADVEDLTEIMQDDQEEANPSIDAAEVEEQSFGPSESANRDEEVAADSDTRGLTRYESSSADLPSLGHEASEVAGSLEGLRESLRRH